MGRLIVLVRSPRKRLCQPWFANKQSFSSKMRRSTIGGQRSKYDLDTYYFQYMLIPIQLGRLLTNEQKAAIRSRTLTLLDEPVDVVGCPL